MCSSSGVLAAPNQLDLAFAKYGVRLAYRTVDTGEWLDEDAEGNPVIVRVVPNCAFFAAEAEERLPDKVEEISGAHPGRPDRRSVPRMIAPACNHLRSATHRQGRHRLWRAPRSAAHRPRANGRCGFCEGTFAGARGNDGVAPKAAVRVDGSIPYLTDVRAA